MSDDVDERVRTRTNTDNGQITRTEHKMRVVEKYGAPGGTRTPDPLLRRQTLYPAELRARILDSFIYFTTLTQVSQLLTPPILCGLSTLCGQVPYQRFTFPIPR